MLSQRESAGNIWHSTRKVKPTNKVSRVFDDEATRVAEGAKVMGHKDLSDFYKPE